jgi:hypothetical protein
VSTPKQQYEARKAERVAEMKRREEHWAKVSQLDAVIREKTSTLELLKMADRFVTALELIADAIGQQHPPHVRQPNQER